MNSGKTLLDKAQDQCNGSMYAVAKRTGIPESTLSDAKAGKLGLSPTNAALLAELVGDDPREAALSAIVSQAKKPAAKNKLTALFRLAPTAGAVLATVTLLGAPSPSAASVNGAATDSTGGGLYIMTTIR